MSTRRKRPALPDPVTEPTISVDRAAELLGIGRASAYKAANTGDLPVIRIGHRMRVPTARVLALLGHDAGSEPAQAPGYVDHRDAVQQV